MISLDEIIILCGGSAIAKTRKDTGQNLKVKYK